MKRTLPRWNKAAMIAMVRKDLTYDVIAEDTGYSRQHVSAVIHGRTNSTVAIKKISDYLGISDDGADEKPA